MYSTCRFLYIGGLNDDLHTMLLHLNNFCIIHICFLNFYLFLYKHLFIVLKLASVLLFIAQVLDV